MSTFRCFVATAIPLDTKDYLERFVRQVAPSFPAYRFVAPQNLHITLQFLGDVERSRIPALMQALNRSTQDTPGFRLELGDAGVFPLRGGPRILHVAVSRGEQELARLAREVAGGLSALGYRPEKPFAAHVTLGRARDRRGGQPEDASGWRQAFARFRETAVPEAWETGEVLLMESVLGPGGPTYIQRGRALLEVRGS